MKALLYVSVIVVSFGLMGSQKPETPVRSDYGSATVSSVVKLDGQCLIYCNLKDLPPVVGESMPVHINGLKPAANPQANLPLLRYLNELLLSENKPESVVLKNIRRGQTFCLVADIEVDQRDLCDLMIKKGLVQRVIEVKGQGVAGGPILVTSSTTGTQTSNSPAGAYLASKSSKVYHRPTCMHAKRMDMSKAVNFSSRDEAEKTGRRPCKTCRP
jgi:hypothetical protein